MIEILGWIFMAYLFIGLFFFVIFFVFSFRDIFPPRFGASDFLFNIDFKNINYKLLAFCFICIVGWSGMLAEEYL